MPQKEKGSWLRPRPFGKNPFRTLVSRSVLRESDKLRGKIFAFRLHKERRVEGARGRVRCFLPPDSSPRLCWGGDVAGGTILNLQTALWGLRFLAARRSSCGGAPPRPGRLLKTREKAQGARRSKPPACPEPGSARVGLRRGEQRRTSRPPTRHELTGCPCGPGGSGGSGGSSCFCHDNRLDSIYDTI